MKRTVKPLFKTIQTGLVEPIPRRQLSIFTRIQSALNSRYENVKEKSSKQQKDKLLENLMQIPKYTINDFSKHIDTSIAEGTSGWKSLLPQDKAGLAEAEIVKNILQAMTPIEKHRFRQLGEIDFKRIAQISGQPEEKVESTIRQFTMLNAIHRWMKIREKEGQKLPEDLDKIMQMILVDRRGLQESTPRWVIEATKKQNRLKANKRRKHKLYAYE
eukprot:maker-scaffold_26-snap-gene-2.55-mRNA-1 protein AED:0.02 eAED:0.02 QI:109/1/1/1/0.33/0.25/4/87/215